MVYELFVKQLDGCTYHAQGDNCTCACEAMWLFRASQGKIKTTSCAVRTKTQDRVDGTNLGQMEIVSLAAGIDGGRVYRPAGWDTLTTAIASRRYGSHLNIRYRKLSGTRYDCFHGAFKGNHDLFISGPGRLSGTWRVGDPGADGRRETTPDGFQDIPVSLLKACAGDLDLGGHPLGFGRAYIYLTPPDPRTTASPKVHATVIHPTSVWNDGTKRWVYGGANAIKIGTPLICRTATYVKGNVACYPIDPSSPNYPRYFVPKVNVKLGAAA
jgi:hypothetical protein